MFGQMANLLNTFAEIGGFEAIISFLKAGNETQEEKMPFNLITLIISPFRTCNSLQLGFRTIVHLSSQRDLVAEARWDD